MGQSLYVTMEYLREGDLRSYVESAGLPLQQRAVQTIASQILEGLCLLHTEGFAHRDMKPSNILIVSSPPRPWWVKISDFGLTKRLGSAQTDSGQKGTPAFTAPEQLGLASPTAEDTHRASDMWSLGETVFWLLTKVRTFRDMAALSHYISGTSKFPSNMLKERKVSPEGIDFVQLCMAPRPDARPLAFAALEHKWIADSAPHGAPSSWPAQPSRYACRSCRIDRWSS